MHIPAKDKEEYKAMSPSQRKTYRNNRKKEMLARFKTKEKKVEAKAEADKPRSVAQLQGDIQKALNDHSIDPLVELLKQCKKGGKLPAKEKVAIYKFLMPYIHAQKKSIDIQADMKMNVSVTMQSFADASQKALNAEIVNLDEDEYKEFEDKLIED